MSYLTCYQLVVSASIVPMMFTLAVSAGVAPDHATIRLSPGCMSGIASATVPLPLYTVPTSCDGTDPLPRYTSATDVSKAPVVVAIVACAGYQIVPSPCGPASSVISPDPGTVPS